MGLKKAYDELTDKPEFTSGLQVSTGQSIEDGGGTDRLQIRSNSTGLVNPDGQRVISSQGNLTEIRTYSDKPLLLDDKEGGFTALQYTTDATKGTLELPNAELEVSGKIHAFPTVADAGATSDPALRMGSQGAGFYLDPSGNVEATDNNGDKVQLV